MEELKVFLVTLFWILLFCGVLLFMVLRTCLPYVAGFAGLLFFLATKPPKGNGR